MKNLMAIFSIVVLLASAMTTIGCDEKKDEKKDGDESTAFSVTGVPTDYKESSGEIKTAYTGASPTTKPALTVKNIPDAAKKVSLIQVKKDGTAVTITKLKEVDKAASGDTTIAHGTWDIATAVTTGTSYIEYEFHVIGTTTAYTVPTGATSFTDAWTKILAVKDSSQKAVVVDKAHKQKIMDGKVKK